ncbi:hypothetical protein LIS90_13535 [Flavobacterium psychrophilum]|uniref:hypothetical protein n=1 Tax=Flavobacterium psychrophilum TaxID=96345 RepID=UPI000618795B|nr:hypothetical protein [Flavobacterium psychrophilum]ELM3645234.1 hypothetical protein [Flavobacterium psychrophilum]MBF2092694.1 hypothetical protein [Flavobacterium psychrophilum]MCB6089684.1 hypothetical protein [Flavobacterium psychrophilum]MCB6232268.1 hypothetical protein [Flavobacterium psychrophilum]MEB3380581.1 hypothetical protein [Flavobacterium psychrophilum]
MRKHNNILFIYLIFGCAFIFNCCGQTKFKPKDIIGKWSLTIKQLNYPTLIFKSDSTAVFTSMGDTIYRFKYFVDRKQLFLKDINGRLTKNNILKLDKEYLVFKTLLDNSKIQIYKRN